MHKTLGLMKLIAITILIMVFYFVGAIFSILLSPVVIGLIAYGVYKLNNNKTNKE
jgi:hypothetical protein